MTITAASMLGVTELSKTYITRDGEQVNALAPTTLDVREGEFIACVGPSGCGKSTLLRIVAGLLAPTSGQVTIRGRVGKFAKSDIGVVFQKPVLLPWLNVLENTMLPARVLKLDLKESRSRAMELIELAGLNGFEKSYPGELSGGMQQRNAIIRSLLHDPGLLLMDEPFGALDAMTRELMNLELQRIWADSGKTVFFITHSINEAVFLADRVIVMSPRPGRVIADIAINLPRMRTIESMSEPGFVDATAAVRDLLNTESRID